MYIKVIFHFSSRIRLIVLMFFTFYGTLPGAAQCNATLWNHVYNSSRFTVHNQCTYAIGYIQEIYAEPDGDYHIRLKLEPDFKYMMNALNISSTGSDLVGEIICANNITQSDAVAPCHNYTSSVYVPNVGEHVKITGSYVTDNVHGWNEIHPITSIEITSQTDTLSTGISISNDNNIVFAVFPSPASSLVNFYLSDHPPTTVFLTITDAIGRLAGQYQMKENPKFEINTTYFPNGIYYYSAIMNDKLISSGKFIVAH